LGLTLPTWLKLVIEIDGGQHESRLAEDLSDTACCDFGTTMYLLAEIQRVMR